MISEFKKVFKNSKFFYLWVSQILSQITIHMMNFLLLARLFAITGSSIATSLLWIAYALPSIFFGPIGAATADIVSRRKTLMLTNLLQALTVFAFIFTHESSIFLLYGVVLIYSFLNQFYVPAESSSLPSLVKKEKLPQANSLFFITQQVALILGFGFAGVMQGIIGFRGSLIVCSSLLFTAFVSVSFLPDLRADKKITKTFEGLILGFFKSIYEGYEFIKGRKSIFYSLMLLLGIQISVAIVTINLPVIATGILKVSTSLAGVLMVIPAGIGATLGSLIISKMLKGGVRKRFLIEYGLLTIGGSLLIVSFVTLFLSVPLMTIFVPVILVLTGLGFVAANIPTLTYLQEVTPVGLRGRVFGNLWFLITISTIFPILFSGVFIEFFGIRAMLTLMAFLFLAVYYLFVKKAKI